MNEDDRKKRKR